MNRAQKILVILHRVTARVRREGWIATNLGEKAETVTVKPSGDFDHGEPSSAAGVASCGNVSPVIDPWPAGRRVVGNAKAPCLRGFREG